ncbi:MAG: AzlD domain-containing protein [Fimbriimonadaceae bacterium]|nr:AzlD domain-containing protein [Alphaproteobacteria bacterium]
MMMGEGWGALVYLFVAGYIATDVWRLLGVLAAVRVNEDSEVFRWVKSVSTALVAALIARIVLFPVGALADVPLWVRVAALGIGIAVYLAAKRSIAFGILAGEAFLLIGSVTF